MFLIALSDRGRNAGSGVMVDVLDSGVQPQKFLRSFFSFESLLLSFLTPCRSVRLLNDIVAASRGNHLLMVDP
ncbi:hypothetical protein, partial [Deinococcus frigens]|uniref:hypothetical protein n=1 Tax=Deinococcus frigens TaxID=249403 RepID=UPI001B805B9C